MEKKPAGTAADIKTGIKTTGEKATEKVTAAKASVKTASESVAKTTAAAVKETKAAVEKKVAEVKDAVKAEETKTAAKVEAVKKEAAAEEKKVAAKAEETKAAAKKTVKKAAKKVAEKKEEVLVPEVFIQFNNREDVVADVVERAKAAYVADGHKASAIKSFQVYLKPEDGKAYYVVNQKYAGQVNLF